MSNNNSTRIQQTETILQGSKEQVKQIAEIHKTIVQFFESRIDQDSPYTILDSFYRLFILQDETVNQECQETGQAGGERQRDPCPCGQCPSSCHG